MLQQLCLPVYVIPAQLLLRHPSQTMREAHDPSQEIEDSSDDEGSREQDSNAAPVRNSAKSTPQKRVHEVVRHVLGNIYPISCQDEHKQDTDSSNKKHKSHNNKVSWQCYAGSPDCSWCSSVHLVAL